LGKSIIMSDFKFEQLEVWQTAIKLSSDLFDLTDKPALKSNYRFSNQLNGATMSITNNIAEGSGAASKKEFARYLSIARSLVFEVSNILFLFQNRGIITEKERLAYYQKLLILSKNLYFLRKSLLS